MIAFEAIFIYILSLETEPMLFTWATVLGISSCA